jgi:hypothetical protein
MANICNALGGHINMKFIVCHIIDELIDSFSSESEICDPNLGVGDGGGGGECGRKRLRYPLMRMNLMNAQKRVSC